MKITRNTGLVALVASVAIAAGSIVSASPASAATVTRSAKCYFNGGPSFTNVILTVDDTGNYAHTTKIGFSGGVAVDQIKWTRYDESDARKRESGTLTFAGLPLSGSKPVTTAATAKSEDTTIVANVRKAGTTTTCGVFIDEQAD